MVDVQFFWNVIAEKLSRMFTEHPKELQKKRMEAIRKRKALKPNVLTICPERALCGFHCLKANRF